MLILGLNDSNSAAAIIRDGRLVAAAREERFDRIKFSEVYPTQAVNYCLRAAGVTLKQVDHVVFAWNPGHEIEPQYGAAAVRNHKHFLHYIPNNLLRHVGGDKLNKRITAIDERLSFLEGKLEIHFVPHHESHAASAFFISPFEEAAIMTMDAYGDDVTHAFFRGQRNRMERLGWTPFPHSIGSVYAAMTQYLGYRANADEWKVMGLAAYGEPEFYDKFNELIRFDREIGELRVNLDYFSYYIWSPRRYSDLFLRTFGPERYYGDELTERHINLAASFQKRVEEIGLEMAVWLHEKTGLKALCLSGGVFMNSRMNGLLLKDSPFDKVWVQPSADDAGGSLGSCFFYWNQILGKERDFIMEHDYWGPGFDDDEIRKTLDDSLVAYERLEYPEKEAAAAIAAGKVIGWFQGRMEFGQRALGNRSILADARDPQMKDKINRLIKHREWYRPFAPAVLAECQSEYFDLDFPSDYMQMVFPIKKEKQEIIPAVVHADGTGRIQTIRKEINPKYWNLVNEFRKLTGVGVILNTSFNDNDEPIVCTPRDAIRTFYCTGLQELYIGSYRLIKDKNL
jgi:carbamoyltransferase